MSKRVVSSAATVSVGLLATLITVGPSQAIVVCERGAIGAERAPAPGGHWFYHLDRASDRKCWYLEDLGGPFWHDVRVVQPAPADDLKNGEAEPPRQSRMVLASKQHRSVHLRPPAEHAKERPAASRNQSERDALFEEFLRWRERQWAWGMSHLD